MPHRNEPGPDKHYTAFGYRDRDVLAQPLILPAETADAAGIAEVQVAAWRAAYRDIVPHDYLQSLSVERRARIWRQSIAKGIPEVRVATAGPVIVGWVAYGQCRDPDKSPDTGEIWALYVAPDYWSRGVGRALWRAARTRLVERGFKEIALWVLKGNERAIRFYRAAGFFPDERTIRKIRIGAALLDEIRYETLLVS